MIYAFLYADDSTDASTELRSNTLSTESLVDSLPVLRFNKLGKYEYGDVYTVEFDLDFQNLINNNIIPFKMKYGNEFLKSSSIDYFYETISIKDDYIQYNVDCYIIIPETGVWKSKYSVYFFSSKDKFAEYLPETINTLSNTEIPT